MKNQPQRPLTFGDFVASVYDACGHGEARGIVWLAVNSRLIQFRSRDLYSISNRFRAGLRVANPRPSRQLFL